MPTQMKNGYIWYVSKMRRGGEEERREAGAEVHFQAEDGQDFLVETSSL